MLLKSLDHKNIYINAFFRILTIMLLMCNKIIKEMHIIELQCNI